MSTAPPIQSSTPTSALAHIGVASDPSLANTALNEDLVTTRADGPDREQDNGKLSPLTPLSEEEGENPLSITTKAAPLNNSQEEYAVGSDEEVERSDHDPPYSPGDRSPDADHSELLHYGHRRPLGVSTSAVSKSNVNKLDPNGGQCLLTRDLATETGVENAHLLPQAWNNKLELVSEILLPSMNRD